MAAVLIWIGKTQWFKKLSLCFVWIHSIHRTLKLSGQNPNDGCSIRGILQAGKKKLEAKSNYDLEVNEFQS
jgi:hypothetical protein